MASTPCCHATIKVVNDGPDSIAGATVPEPARPALGAPSRKALAMVVIPIIALVVANNLGNAFAPAMLPVPGDPTRPSNPLLLIALSPAIRNQIAVVNYVDPWLFLGIAGLRLLVADPLFFLLGRWYGDAGIAWMEKRSSMAGEMLRQVESWFAKASVVLVFIAANNIVCVLAGASGMRKLWFWVANVAGTLTRLLLIMLFADLLSSQIDTVLDWVGDYRPWLLAVSIAAVAVVGVRQLRSSGGEIEQLRQLSDDLADAHEPDDLADTPGPDDLADTPGPDDLADTPGPDERA
jgi:membrane protein DedA with SNARE-associated domain